MIEIMLTAQQWDILKQLIAGDAVSPSDYALKDLIVVKLVEWNHVAARWDITSAGRALIEAHTASDSTPANIAAIEATGETEDSIEAITRDVQYKKANRLQAITRLRAIRTFSLEDALAEVKCMEAGRLTWEQQAAEIERLQADIGSLTARNRKLAIENEQAAACIEDFKNRIAGELLDQPIRDLISNNRDNTLVDRITAILLDTNAGADLLARLQAAESDRDTLKAALVEIIGDSPSEETVKSVGSFFWAVAKDETIIRYQLSKIARKALEALKS